MHPLGRQAIKPIRAPLAPTRYDCNLLVEVLIFRQLYDQGSTFHPLNRIQHPYSSAVVTTSITIIIISYIIRTSFTFFKHVSR
jgi:hypothetical protein